VASGERPLGFAMSNDVDARKSAGHKIEMAGGWNGRIMRVRAGGRLR
jgi:hypothetical protein